jgi:phage terminase large subunit GpA-like protein
LIVANVTESGRYRSGSENPSGAASRCHFPEYNTEYFKQLTGEQLITKIVKGYPKREWQKTRDRNEALDCRVYARAAAIAMGVDRRSESKWEQMAGKAESTRNTTREAVRQYPEKVPAVVNRAVPAPARPRIVRSSLL